MSDFDPAQYLKEPEEGERGSGEKNFDPKEYLNPKPKKGEVFNADGPSTFFKVLEMPVNALQAAIGAAQDASSIGEAIDRAIPAAKAQVSLLPDKPAPTKFEEIIAKDEMRHGIPPVFAHDAGAMLGPPARLIGDPLNFLSPPVGEGARAAFTGVREGIDLAKAATREGLDLMGEGAAKLAADAARPKPGIVDRAVTTFFGPGEEAVAAYRANPKIIEKAVGPVEIKNRLDKTVKRVKNVISEKKANVEKIKADWDDAAAIKTNELQQTAARPTQMQGDVLNAIDELKQQVSDKSAQAFDILEEAGVAIPTQRLKAALQFEINQFASVPKVTPEGKAAVQRLQAIRDNLDELPKELSGSQAKSIIQELDAVREQAMRRGEYLDGEERIKRLFRGTIDGYLKENEAYKTLMAELAEDTRVLKEASRVFGDERRLPTKLRGLLGDGAAVDRQLLAELGQRTGRGEEFAGAINESLGAQRILKSKDFKDQIRQALPEAQAFADAAEDLALAEETFARVNQKLGIDSTENVVKQLLRENNVEAAKVVQDLEKLTGENFTELVMAERLKMAFEGGRANGSRAVTMGGDIGEALADGASAALTKGLARGGAIGRAVGAITGGAIDRYGGQMARAAIDKQISAKVSGLRAFGEKIASKAGPDTDAGTFGRALLYHAPSIAMELMRPDSEINIKGEMVITDPGMLEEARRAIKANRGMTSIEKAEVLSKINETGTFELKLDAPPGPPAFGMTPAKRPEDTKTLQDLLNGIKNAVGPSAGLAE